MKNFVQIITFTNVGIRREATVQRRTPINILTIFTTDKIRFTKQAYVT